MAFMKVFYFHGNRCGRSKCWQQQQQQKHENQFLRGRLVLSTAAKAFLALTSRYGRIISLRWYKTIRLCGSWYYGQFWNITSGIYAKYSEETMLLQILIFHPSTIVPFTLCPSPWCTVRANEFRRLRKLKSWSWFIILQNPPIHWATFIIWT